MVTVGGIDPIAGLDAETDKGPVGPKLEDLAKNNLGVVMPESSLSQSIAHGLGHVVEIGLGRHGGVPALVCLD